MPVGLEHVLEDADVLVLHSAWAPHNNRAAAVARRRGVPYVLEPRGEYDPHVVGRHAVRKKVWWFGAERTLVTRARAVHLFFESQRAQLEALGYGGSFVVTPNGVEPPAGVRWDGGTGTYVLWLGRFDPAHKGLDLLIDAVRSLSPDERPQVRLHGPDRRGGKARVRAMVEARGLERDIAVGDAVYGDEKWRLLSRASAFVYPSRWEGFGNAVAEAASIGVPCLTTPYPLGRALEERGGAVMVDATAATIADGLCKITSSGAESIGEAGARYAAEAVWIPLLQRLTTVAPTWAVWKNVDSALQRDGDIDSMAAPSEWAAIERETRVWAARHGLGPVVACTHIPGGLNLVVADADSPYLFEIGVKERKLFRGSALFTYDQLVPLSVLDPRGFRRVAPGAEGVLKLLLNGTRRGGGKDAAGLRDKNVVALLTADPEGAHRCASAIGGAAGPALRRAADAAAAGGWDRGAMAIVEARALLRTLAEPGMTVRRVRFLASGKNPCPVVHALLGNARYIPGDRERWLADVAATHSLVAEVPA